MGRNRPGQHQSFAQSPIKHYVRWKGGDGKWEVYNSETKEKRELDALRFVYLDQRYMVEGYDESKGSGIRSNMVLSLSDQPMKVIYTKDRSVIAEGLYSDIKDQVKPEGKYTEAVIAMMVEKEGNTLVQISMNGSAFSGDFKGENNEFGWNQFRRGVEHNGKYGFDALDSADFGVVSDEMSPELKNGSVKFHAPKFRKAEFKKGKDKLMEQADAMVEEWYAYIDQFKDTTEVMPDKYMDQTTDKSLEELKEQVSSYSNANQLLDAWPAIVEMAGSLTSAELEELIAAAEKRGEDLGADATFKIDGKVEQLAEDDLPF